MTQYIYAFDEGRISMKDLLGGKGANLSEMKRLGLPVPDGLMDLQLQPRHVLIT